MAPNSMLHTDTLVDFDHATQIATHIHEEDGIMTVASMQDAEDIIETNKLKYNDVDERARYGETFTQMASIPLNIWFELWRTGVAQDEKALRRWVNDRDNSAWRTRPGRI